MNDPVSRIRIVSIATILFALLLVVKLYYVQILSGDAFQERADRQYTRPVGGLFDRGTIFFQSKDGTLMAAASLKQGSTIAINPKILKNPEEASQKISGIIPLDKESFVAKASKPNDSYEEIAKRVDLTLAKQVEDLDLTGVNIYKEKWRYYPGETLAAQVLGFVGYDNNNNYSGRYGLENEYNHVLERSTENVYVNFFAEIFSDIHKSFTDTGTIEGDIVSTIEPNVQAYLEKQLQLTQDKYRSKLTGGIIINPKNGEIYAMGAVPAFNPNSFQSEKNVSVFTNPLVQNVYELGSIMKPLTMAAGLDAGVVTADTTINDPGFVELNGKTIYDFDKKNRGIVSMQTVLNDSLNVGAAYVAQKLGKTKFADYMYKYGFGTKTGIDLPDEAKGLVDNLKSPRDVEHATAAFGQGIAISPIAMTQALSTMANGGTRITPHVIKKIEYKVGFAKDISYPAGTRVIKPETSREISRMLTEVYDKALLNGSVKMEHYSISAKTGTAQIAKPGGGGYYPDRYLHSFFDYFPSYDPKFLIFLYTVEPQGEAYASHTLTQPAVDLTKYLINYYEIPPDR